MNKRLTKVKEFVAQLGIRIVKEIPDDEILIVNDEDNGIVNMVLDCEESILIIEQSVMPCVASRADVCKRLLQLNRHFIHGAFVLNEKADMVIFRDTLQLETLDLKELEASINSLSLFLAEHSKELIQLARSN